MVRRSDSFFKTIFFICVLINVSQASIFGNFTLGISNIFEKCNCQNFFSKILEGLRNLLGFRPPAPAAPTTVAPTTTAAPAANTTTTPPPKNNRYQQLSNRYSDLSWIYNFMGMNDDFPDYDAAETYKNPGVLATCHCDCGVSNQNTTSGISGKIVGGVPTKQHEYPWLARVQYRNEFHCGASLINKDYVITAAHCVDGRSRSRFRVVLGDHNRLSSLSSNAQVRQVSEIVRHKHYNERTMNSDIALMRLNRPVTFSSYIRPICQPSQDATFGGKLGTIVGWGTVSEQGTTSAVPLQAQVLVYSAEQCRAFKYRPSEIGDNMICAGGESKDSCQGDSGGPLQLKNSKNKYELAGVVSWGNGCGREGYPGIYTNVAKYYSWIIDNMRDTCVCVS